MARRVAAQHCKTHSRPVRIAGTRHHRPTYHRGLKRTDVADEIDNIIVEHLEAIRGDLGDLKRDVRDATMRLGSLEHQVASLHTNAGHIQEDMAIVQHRIDGLSDRVARIERRLDLTEAS